MNDEKGKKIDFEKLDIKDLIKSNPKKIDDLEAPAFNITEKLSPVLTDEEKYERAKALIKNESECTIEDCVKAKEVFESLEKNDDLSDLIDKCDWLIKERKYSAVINLMGRQKYEYALTILSTLEGFKDTDNLKEQCMKGLEKIKEKKKAIVRRNRKIAIILSAILVPAIVVFSIVGYINNPQNWSEYFLLDYEEDSVSIVSVKEEYRDAKKIVIPEEIKGYKITNILSDAFRNCVNLESVEIPDSVTKIGDFAFAQCTSLKSVEIPNGVIRIGESAFSGCTSLESMTLPFVGSGSGGRSNAYLGYIFGANSYQDNNTYVPTTLKTVVITGGNKIEMSAFYECSNITSITISDCVISIDQNAFLGCTSLESITLPFIGQRYDGTGNTYFGYIFGTNSYDDDSHIPSTLKTVVISGGNAIQDNAFRNCSYLESISISNTITYIGNNVFDGCVNLTSINVDSQNTTYSSINGVLFDKNIKTLIYYPLAKQEKEYKIPSGVTSISAFAFIGHSNLTSVEIPNSMTSIEESTFSGCTGLKSIIIPSGVTSIGAFAFMGCNKLTSIEIPNSVINIGESAFSGCTGLKSIIILNGAVGNFAFMGCSNLTSVEISNGVTSIGESAFSGCTSLESMTLPFVGQKYDGTGATHFGYIFGANSYSNNSTYVPTTLKSVVITDGNIIVNNAFRGCSNITSVVMPNSMRSIGESAFSGCTGLRSIIIPSGVKSIAQNAFSGCTSLESIILPFVGQKYDGTGATHFGYIFGANSYSYNSMYIPTTLKSIIITGENDIAQYAFYGCNSIESMTLPFVGQKNDGTGSTHFGYIFGANSYSDNNTYIPTTLKNVVITGGIKIESYAFYECDSIVNIEILDGVTSIAQNAFLGCTSLESMTLPFVGNRYDGTGATHFGYIFGANSYSNNNTYVPSTLKTVIILGGDKIEDNAFYYCGSLVTIEISESVISIGVSTFSRCEALKNINIASENAYYSSVNGILYDKEQTTLIRYPMGKQEMAYVVPSGVTSIGTYAFSGCSSLQSINLPNSVTSIGGSAFSGCSSLQSINLPNSVTSIGGSAFSGCSSLQSIIIPSGVTSIGSGAFYYCSTLQSVTIPSQVTVISDYAFSDCSLLKTVNLPSGISTIGSEAFYNCSSLAGIDLPNSVTSIGSYAFLGCTSLTSVKIPSSVKSIGNSAFSKCSSLTTVYLNRTSSAGITSLGNNAFSNCTLLANIYVPNAASVTAYQNANNWMNYSSLIKVKP